MSSLNYDVQLSRFKQAVWAESFFLQNGEIYGLVQSTGYPQFFPAVPGESTTTNDGAFQLLGDWVQNGITINGVSHEAKAKAKSIVELQNNPAKVKATNVYTNYGNVNEPATNMCAHGHGSGMCYARRKFKVNDPGMGGQQIVKCLFRIKGQTTSSLLLTPAASWNFRVTLECKIGDCSLKAWYDHVQNVWKFSGYLRFQYGGSLINIGTNTSPGNDIDLTYSTNFLIASGQQFEPFCWINMAGGDPHTQGGWKDEGLANRACTDDPVNYPEDILDELDVYSQVEVLSVENWA